MLDLTGYDLLHCKVIWISMSLALPPTKLAPQNHLLTLRRAQRLSRSILDGARDAEKAWQKDDERRKADAGSVLEVKASQLRARAQEKIDVAKSCDTCIELVNDMHRRLGLSMRRLQHARYAQFAELKVCERRLDLRCTAPAEELLADQAQKALEEEKRCIIASREDILKFESEVKNALEVMEGLRDSLLKDSASQRIAAEHCRAATVIALNQSKLGMSVAPEDSCADEEYETESCRDGVERAYVLIAAAEGLSVKSAEIVKTTGELCRQAKDRVEACLERCALATEEAAKALRHGAAEVDYTLLVAERSLVKSGKKLAGREAIAKEAKLDQTFALLGDLRDTRQELQAQIQRKLLMLGIDESCRKVTAQAATGADYGRLRRPMSSGALRRSNSAVFASKDASEFSCIPSNSRGLRPALSLEASTLVEASESASTAASFRPHSASHRLFKKI